MVCANPPSPAAPHCLTPPVRGQTFAELTLDTHHTWNDFMICSSLTLFPSPHLTPTPTATTVSATLHVFDMTWTAVCFFPVVPVSVVPGRTMGGGVRLTRYQLLQSPVDSGGMRLPCSLLLLPIHCRMTAGVTIVLVVIVFKTRFVGGRGRSSLNRWW